MVADKSERQSVLRRRALVGSRIGLWLLTWLFIVWSLDSFSLIPRTEVELSSSGLMTPDGSWDLDALEATCKAALARHGVDIASARQVEYTPGKLVGENASNPNRALTAWRVGPADRGVSVYVEIVEDTACCVVSDWK